jgi:hypothetical protein
MSVNDNPLSMARGAASNGLSVKRHITGGLCGGGWDRRKKWRNPGALALLAACLCAGAARANMPGYFPRATNTFVLTNRPATNPPTVKPGAAQPNSPSKSSKTGAVAGGLALTAAFVGLGLLAGPWARKR